MSPAQTALSKPMLDELNSTSDLTDCGSLQTTTLGVFLLHELAARAPRCTPTDQVIVNGSSSLTTLCTTSFLMP